MALEEAGAWLDDDGLTLPIAGKKYRVPEPSAELGIRLEVLLNTASRGTERRQQVLDDQQERDLYAELLGDAYEQMLKAGVSYSLLKLAAVTAMYHFVIDPSVAESIWNEGVSKGKAAGSRSGSSRPATRRTTAGASSTKSRASGSGTRPRRSS